MRAISLLRQSIVATLSFAFTLLLACGGGDSRNGDGLPTSPDDRIFPAVNGLAACGSTNALMTVIPVPIADLLGWVPLGNLNPPGHLFPTDHQYLYVNEPGRTSTYRKVDLFAPANITITRARRTHYSLSNTYDYVIEFAVCNEVRGEFGHVSSIAQDLMDQLGAFDQFCSSYNLGGSETFTGCSTRNLMVTRPAGVLLGTTAGIGTSFALDFTLRDSRRAPLVFANNARWQSTQPQVLYTVGASDYFAEPAATAIRAKIGNYNGTSLRTAEPRGGTIGYDIAGTMRGLWFNPSKSTFPEGTHLAFVPDAIDPTVATISLGMSQPFYNAGLYRFTPRADGLVNRDPSAITNVGIIYCFEFQPTQGVLLMQLTTSTSLRVEGRKEALNCAAESPWTFTNRTFDYVR